MAEKRQVHLAVDLGAGSGRVVAGIYNGSRLDLQELSRFPNDPVKQADGWHWNLDGLMKRITDGVALAVKRFGADVVSLGADTWGVDYGLLGPGQRLLHAPFHYRDARTQGMMEAAFQRMPSREIYERTGIQFMFFNTLFQLLADSTVPGRLEKAERLLFMPDLIHFLLTGVASNEKSIASTSQLLKPKNQQWDFELIRTMGLPMKIFAETANAGSILGKLKSQIIDDTGAYKLRVIAPAGHDTASAVVGVPADEASPVFLSSGTWSLFGRELPQPVVTDASYSAAFSNEGGVFGTIRFLRNIAGMWLLQETKRAWDVSGNAMSYEQLMADAEQAAPFTTCIDPNAEDFNAPPDMPTAISAFCRRTGQTAPTDRGAFTRMILESLALKYREVKNGLVQVTGVPVDTINVIGGGCQHDLLNQFTADALDCIVVAGPTEATSIGNIVMQLHALGEIRSLAEGRALVRNSFKTRVFTPRNPEAWAEAETRFHRRLSS